MLPAPALAGHDLGNLGAFHKWHKVEVNLAGPSTSVMGSPNPFEILVNVTFKGPRSTFVVPAFYDADGTGGASGSVWKVRFSANATGNWGFSTSSSDAALNGYAGTFSVDESPVSASDLLRWGRLQYVGGYYLKFADGGFWIKGGVDDPENVLGGGLGTDWATKKAAVDILCSKGVNSMYAIMNTISPGDSNDTWPWWGNTAADAKANSSRYNTGKLMRWEDFFDYCESKGIVLHLVFDDDSAWHGYDHSLYYREMVARFGHHPAIIWNVGEEANENYSDSQQISRGETIKKWDAFHHPVAVHRRSSSRSNWPFLGNSAFDLASMQVGAGDDGFASASLENMNTVCISNRKASVSAGRPIPVMFDEMPAVRSVSDSDRREMRSRVLYPIYLGGGQFELHYQDQYVQGGNVTLAALGPMLDDMRRAREFVESLPFDQMSPDNSLLSSTNGNFCLAKPGLAYGIYLTSGDNVSLNLSAVRGAYQVKWHNVTTGATSHGPVILGGGWRSLGAPAYSGNVACSVVRTWVVPGTSWSTARASDLGVDLAKLQTFAGSVGGNGMVVKDGYVVHQWGTPGTRVDWGSAVKPTNATALFIAIAERRTTADTAIYPRYWPNAVGKDRRITLGHLANMLSGYMRPEEPGAAWSYNDYGVSLFVKTVYQKVFKSDAQTIMTDRLSPLQFQDGPSWSTGAHYGRLTSCSVRDFARIGWTWVNCGRWGTSTVVPSTLFDQFCKVHVSSSTPQSKGPNTLDLLGVGTMGGGTNQSSDGPGEYGFFWWHNQNNYWPDAATDTYMADGHSGDEAMAMIPSLGIVAVSDGKWGAPPDATRNNNLRLLKESVVPPPGVTDSEPPSKPYNVAATALAPPFSSSIQVTWSPSADNYAVKSYRVYRNGTQIGTSAWTSYTDTTAMMDKEYFYTVSAVDYADNASAQSTPAHGSLH